MKAIFKMVKNKEKFIKNGHFLHIPPPPPRNLGYLIHNINKLKYQVYNISTVVYFQKSVDMKRL